jgi:alkanesulfonate monooxygenase SsuD/methylene tetrahydromethanopterin reductase-like flavin-dependent oxidoreductase (luciferase family)
MTEIGYFLASEEHDGRALVQMARRAEEVGLRRVWISDHYHPPRLCLVRVGFAFDACSGCYASADGSEGLWRGTSPRHPPLSSPRASM